VDWQNLILSFDRCPTDCLITPEKFTNLEQDKPEITINKIDIGEKDHLFFINTTEFMVNRITRPAMKLAIEQSKKECQKNFEEDLSEYLQDYQDVFKEQDFNELPQQ
jgi:hypothetical protein